MFYCSFELNSQPMSAFHIGNISVPAFSGLKPYVNQRANSCLAHFGPIPPGTYYIVDRKSGGKLGWLWDMAGNRSEWFGLYADDQQIDDEVFCEEVKRGNFRLHPMVGRGISKGCITIEKQSDFNRIRLMLRNAGTSAIPGTDLKTYGKITAR